MPKRRPNHDAPADPRLRWLYILIVLILLGILLRLLVLQVLNGDALTLKSIGNIITTVETPALRGEVFDRHGQPLAENKNNLKLLYTPPPGVDRYFPLPADAKRAKERGYYPYYINSRYACQPVRLAAEKLHLSYIDLMTRLDTALAYPRQGDWVSLGAVSREAVGRFGDPETENNELLTRLGFRVEVGETGEGNLLIRPPTDIAQYLPTPETRQLMLSRGVEYHYCNLLVSDKVREERGPSELPDVSKLANYLKAPYGELMSRLQKQQVKMGRPPYTLVEKLNYPQVVFIEEQRDQFQGFTIDEYSFDRSYPLGPATYHLLGYTGFITEKQKDSGRFPYPSNDVVGQEGIEKQYEEMLHGRSGRRNLTRDKTSHTMSLVSDIEPQRGNNIYLSVDAGLQAECYRQLAGRTGAVIVSSLAPGEEGEILAMASSPAVEPDRRRDEQYMAVITNKDNPTKPMLNRAVGVTYEPGSTFKLTVATAGLMTGSIKENSSWTCNGFIPFKGGLRMYCHHRGGHGGVNLRTAIAQSCDVAFYRIGMGLKGDPPAIIKRFAELFGYGAPTGIDLPAEQSGFLPDRAWRRRRFAGPKFNEVDRGWLAGRTCNYAIGQGDTQATPLQVLMASSVIATGGTTFPPRLLYAKEADRQVLKSILPEPIERKLDKNVLAFVHSAMRTTVLAGTCKKLDIPGLQVCAKSGTAETSHGRAAHSWVTGFYPEDHPRYCFVALVEHGGSSGEAAIPIMHEVLKYMKEHDPLSGPSMLTASANESPAK